ncbi:acyl carrier protein [uncultured Aquimarina sp.]|uniref:hypothetical protein n=1 Tax=uncultured Aquimarina sp. TaxID=575652 RepID=UPI00261D9F92|nr:hypothetical protein [uncultured Aquimarina sp.]
MNENQIFELIVANIKKIAVHLEDVTIKKNAILSPLGLDSIGRAELIIQTIEDLQVNAVSSEFYSARNLGELARMFEQKVNNIN